MSSCVTGQPAFKCRHRHHTRCQRTVRSAAAGCCSALHPGNPRLSSLVGLRGRSAGVASFPVPPLHGLARGTQAGAVLRSWLRYLIQAGQKFWQGLQPPLRLPVPFFSIPRSGAGLQPDVLYRAWGLLCCARSDMPLKISFPLQKAQ